MQTEDPDQTPCFYLSLLWHARLKSVWFFTLLKCNVLPLLYDKNDARLYAIAFCDTSCKRNAYQFTSKIQHLIHRWYLPECTEMCIFLYLDRVKRIWYLLPMRAAKVQASLRIRAVSPEPSLLAHTSSESRGTFRQKARSLAPLNGWACAVKICHDGMLEDTNSLDAAHLYLNTYTIICGMKSPLFSINYFQSAFSDCWEHSWNYDISRDSTSVLNNQKRPPKSNWC